MDPSPYAEQRYRDGLDCALRATQYDKNGHYSAALSFYNEAVEALTQATSLASVFSPILTQVGDYSKRADEIRHYLSSSKEKQGEIFSLTSHTPHIYMALLAMEGLVSTYTSW